MVQVRFAHSIDLDQIGVLDSHLSQALLEDKVRKNEVIVLLINKSVVATLRFGYFWDQIPFIHLLVVNEHQRRKGMGRILVEGWEQEMISKGHDLVLTSTQSNEYGQHFFRKLGYIDVEGFALPSEPLEIILMKSLGVK